MEKEFVSYELALELKKLGIDDKGKFNTKIGFNEPCFARYRRGKFQLNTLGKPHRYNSDEIVKDDVSAPLWQQAFGFFMEKYNLVGNTYANASGYLFEIHHSAKKGGSHQHDSAFDGPNDSGCWDEFYEARHACLEKLIELIEQK